MIQVNDLEKWFGPKKAVDRVSFEVAKGEVLGFLGPNGAGKSTSMRMITGYLPMDGGTVKIGDYDMATDPIKAKSLIGYLPENAPSYGEMTVEAFLKFIASLRGFSGKERGKVVDGAIATCFLDPVRYEPIDNLSKGYRHRTCFAQALLHDPKVLVLDEPTDGLDPNQKHEMRNLIKRLGETKSIIISTHILEEVDAVCSRVIVIAEGKLVANSLPSELRAKAPHAGAVTVTVRAAAADATEKLSSLAGSVQLLSETDGLARLQIDANGNGDALSLRVSAAVQEAGWELHELSTEQGRLDDVFRNLTVSGGAS